MNERDMQKLMEKAGWWPVTEEKLVAYQTSVEAAPSQEPVAWMQSNHLNQLVNRHAGSSMMSWSVIGLSLSPIGFSHEGYARSCCGYFINPVWHDELFWL